MVWMLLAADILGLFFTCSVAKISNVVDLSLYVATFIQKPRSANPIFLMLISMLFVGKGT